MASRAVDIQQVQRHGPAQQSGTVGSVRGQLAGPQEAADDLPRCHVTRLDMAGGKIVGVFVNQPPGYVALPPNGRVVVAAATVESTRLALVSFRGMPGYERIGRNLMAHLRSNLTIRVPRTLFPIPAVIKQLEPSALFVKGGTAVQTEHSVTSVCRSQQRGSGARGTDSEGELFKKIPGHRHFETIRWGQRQPRRDHDPWDRDLEPQDPIFSSGSTQRSTSLECSGPSSRSSPPCAMGSLGCDGSVRAGRGQGIRQGPQILGNQRDGLGTTNHQARTLWMGDDPWTFGN